MDHQPYETWLLDDERLTVAQERDLRSHLRDCPECAALSQANMSLRAAPMAVPPAGFVLRFQVRLAAQRRALRLRNIFGLSLILVVGLSVLFLSVPPYLVYLTSSPAQLAATWITNMVYVGVNLQDVSQNSIALMHVIASFVPAYVWGLSLVLIGGMGLLWALSTPTFARIPQLFGNEKSASPADKA
jgi:hypothetical protein